MNSIESRVSGRRDALRLLLRGAILAALCWGTATGVASPRSMFPAPRYSVGHRPQSVAVGDFNGDGREDVVTASSDSVDVTVLLGNGDGTFESGRPIHLIYDSARAVAVGDLDEDRHQDIVAVFEHSGRAALFLGIGDGTFTPGQYWSLGYYGFVDPVAVAVGDFDGDGNPDVVSADYGIDAVTVLSGTGRGVFQNLTQYPVGRQPRSLTPGDFNGDGLQDLITTNEISDDVTVLLADGAGGFAPGLSVAVGDRPTSAAVGDFNGDGHLDMATDSSAGGLTVFLGRGDGSFGAGTFYPLGVSVGAVSADDFDGDGNQDLVSRGGDGVVVLPGHGDGTFGAGVFTTGDGDIMSMVAGDFDGDGHRDLVSASRLSDSLSVLLGEGDGTFDEALSLPVGDAPMAVAAADLNADGHQDLAIANSASNDVTVLLGRGDGTFEPGTSFSAGVGPFSVVVGDFDEDGLADIATANQSSDDVTVLLGHGGGSFSPGASYQAGDGARAAAVGDFNRDGHQDLVSANRFSDDATVLLGRGDGTFAAGPVLRAGDAPMGVAVGDLDDDGREDIVVVNGSSDDVTVFLGLGDGTFAGGRILTVGDAPRGVQLGDWNGDGHLDLATANSVSGDVTVLLGDGHGGFTLAAAYRATTFLNTTGAWPLAAADFNADGRLDLLTAGFVSFRPGQVAVLLGGGDGTFSAPLYFSAGNSPFTVTTADLDEDGLPDIVAADNGTDSISILLNQGLHPPVTDAGSDQVVECAAPDGTGTMLDGSASTDPEALPGTGGTIDSFEWFENFGLPDQVALGSGARLPVSLALGPHDITLRVTTRDGRTDTDRIMVAVVDTQPPALEVVVSPGLLWPPNHGMVDVTAQVTATDVCGASTVVLRSVVSSEPEEAKPRGFGGPSNDIQGADVGTADFAFRFRSERSGAGSGRTYLITYVASDASGNAASATGRVLVPHDSR
jgi:VCBS repeat protein